MAIKQGSKKYNELIAGTLLRLVKDHKKTCNDPNCGISLFLMKDVYEHYKGREVTQKEFGYFM